MLRYTIKLMTKNYFKKTMKNERGFKVFIYTLNPLKHFILTDYR